MSTQVKCLNCGAGHESLKANLSSRPGEGKFVPVDTLTVIRDEVRVICVCCGYSSEWKNFIAKEEPKAEWKTVKNNSVRMVFACNINTCEMKGEEVFVTPDALEIGGFPECPECEYGMNLLRTEIKE